MQALDTPPVAAAPIRGSGRARHVARTAAAWASIVAVWAVCLPRMIPVPTLDRGIFVSVAARLLAGDRLYVGVWDNKDPFFYYAVALGRAVSPRADLVLEVGWVLLACVGTWSLCRSAGVPPRRALVTGFALAPIVLTGGLYLPGYSHLPGIALSMLAIAATARRRPFVAGLLIGLVAAFKLVMLPVVGVAVLVLLLRLDRREALRTLLGVAAAAVVLAVRGELGPYAGSLVLNAAYAESSSLLDPALPGPLAHLVRLERPYADVAAAAIAAGLAWTARSALRRGPGRSARAAGWSAALVATLASVGVLAATGLWPQHDQILLLPALLVLVLVAARPHGRRAAPLPLRAVALVGVAVLLSGPAVLGPPWMQYQRTSSEASAALRSLSATAPEAADLLARAPSGSYARVGQNHDRGAAAALGAWRLACPRFDQYPFDPPAVLAANLRCLPQARFVVVSWDARPDPDHPAWNAYLVDVRRLLSSGYDCTVTRGVRVCEREDLGPPDG